MALEKTWDYDDNRVHGDVSATNNQCAYWLWYIVQVLVGRIALLDQSGNPIATAGVQDWTIAQSSNGVTASAADNWGSVFTIANMVFSSTTGGARSWVCLTNARLGLSIVLDWQGSNAGSLHYRVLLGTVSTGTTTSAPTGSIANIDNGVSLAAATGQAFFDTANVGSTRKVHAKVATDGSFFFLCSLDGSTKFQSVLWLHKLTETQGGDPYPWAMGWEFATAGCMRGGSTFFANTTNNCGVYDNGANQGASPIVPYVFVGGGQSRMLSLAVQRPDGNWEAEALYFFAHTSNRRKGRAQDWVLATTTNGDGWLSPNGVSPLQVQCGEVLLPGRIAPLL